MLSSNKKIMLVVLLFLACSGLGGLWSDKAEAYTYSAYVCSYDGGVYGGGTKATGGMAVGYNRTQGYVQNLPLAIRSEYAGSYITNYYADITVPDDGCTWDINAIVFGLHVSNSSNMRYSQCFSIRATVTTSGVFSGYSPRTATVAANNAAIYAQNAYDAANTAAANAQNAYNAANTAASYAQTAANNTTYNSQSAAYWAYLAAMGAGAAPRIEKVQGLNGATCTTGSSFTVVISATPSSGVQYRATCGSFDSGWTTSNQIAITGLSYGANTATVYVKNAAGNTAQTSVTFFKL